MSRKLAILFAVLALTYVASAAISAGSPSSAYSVTVGKVFENVTDTAFTNLTGGCYFTAGFTNTTNFVWCQAQSTATGGANGNQVTSASWGSTNALVLQRRQINASSPATANATLDTKITTTIVYNAGGIICGGVGYLGIAYGYGSGTAPAYQSDITLAYIAVNGSTPTSVKLTSNSDATLVNNAKACLFDNGIFYVIYTQYKSDGTATANAVYIQGVNITSGAVIYNSTGGVKLFSPTGGAINTYASISGLMATNWTGYGSTTGLLGYSDSSASPATKYYVLPITLATGAPGSAVLLGTDASTTASTTTVPAAGTTTTLVTTIVTTNAIVGAWGSLSTYGVVCTKDVKSVLTTTATPSVTVADVESHVYSNAVYINGSSTASSTFNMTNPTGYYLSKVGGYSTSNGFGLLETYLPVYTATSQSYVKQVNKDTYYANGTSILSAVSLGTFDSGTTVATWQDAAGSPWLGYYTTDSTVTSGFTLAAGYAGEIVTNVLSANVLTSIFATLAFVVAALFAF